jgi:hypothetical protein
VVSQRGLSNNPDGNSLQPLGRDVAAPSGTQIDTLYLENFILKTMIEGLIFQLMSRDAIMLALWRAEATCKEAGLRPEEFMPIIQSVMDNYTRVTKKNPMNSMF